jgi:hypothetical protein
MVRAVVALLLAVYAEGRGGKGGGGNVGSMGVLATVAPVWWVLIGIVTFITGSACIYIKCLRSNNPKIYGEGNIGRELRISDKWGYSSNSGDSGSHPRRNSGG